jgi:hypothetical protein
VFATAAVQVVDADMQGSDLTAIERAFGRGIPRYLRRLGKVSEELMTVGVDREGARV